MAQQFFTTRQLAERWGISPRTLEGQRRNGSGVPFVRIGKLVRYAAEDVLAHEAMQKTRSVKHECRSQR